MPAGKKFAVNTLLEKYVPNGYWMGTEDGTVGWRAAGMDTNKLGAKLAVIGFYVRRQLVSAGGWAVLCKAGGSSYKEHNLIFVCPSAQKSWS